MGKRGPRTLNLNVAEAREWAAYVRQVLAETKTSVAWLGKVSTEVRGATESGGDFRTVDRADARWVQKALDDARKITVDSATTKTLSVELAADVIRALSEHVEAFYDLPTFARRIETSPRWWPDVMVRTLTSAGLYDASRSDAASIAADFYDLVTARATAEALVRNDAVAESQRPAAERVLFEEAVKRRRPDL
jgi:hypothetical protein